ncbi:MAG: hypothetical protein ACKOC5_17875 [Chloroflexota bacterium]
MRIIRWTMMLFAIGLLLAACQPGGSLSLSEPAAGLAQPQVEQPVQAAATEIVPTAAPEMPNECLNCHADKQRLIDTAKPEEPAAESESSGVG